MNKIKTVIFTLIAVLMAASPVAFACECLLCDAVAKRDLATIESLLGEGADVNAKNHEGLTPLMIAAKEGVPEVIKLLLSAGADRDLHLPLDKGGSTAFDFAIEPGYDAAADVLKNFNPPQPPEEYLAGLREGYVASQRLKYCSHTDGAMESDTNSAAKPQVDCWRNGVAWFRAPSGYTEEELAWCVENSHK